MSVWFIDRILICTWLRTNFSWRHAHTYKRK